MPLRGPDIKKIIVVGKKKHALQLQNQSKTDKRGKNDESDKKRRGCVFKDRCHIKVNEFTSEV